MSEAQQEPEARILVRRNGPYRVYGPISLVDHEGREYTIPAGDWYVLCRCGHSSTKPFCDGTHKQLDFDAPSDATIPIVHERAERRGQTP
jgi:CDGSH-type Zn-finger protein